jgi:hypothetical protein
MTKDELRIWAMEMYLGFVSERWIEVNIQKALKKAGGNIEQAIKLCSGESTGFGWCGYFGDGAWNMNGFRDGIDVWFPENKTRQEPDVHIKTEELFRYVQEGKPKNIQMEMFQ